MATGVGGNAEEIGLTNDRVRTMAASRLAAAGVYQDFSGEYPTPRTADIFAPRLGRLGVFVETSGPAFSARVAHEKDLLDPITELENPSTTWERNTFGTHGNDVGFILQWVSETLDEFVLEYLRVNDASCN